MKKVLTLSGSPRKNGNSDSLCDEFMRGAVESGNNVTKINVAEKNVAPCLPATPAKIQENVLLGTIWRIFCKQ